MTTTNLLRRNKTAPLRLTARLAAACLVAASFGPVALAADAPSAAAKAPQGQPILRRTPLTLGIHVVQAEVASSFSTRAQGLMFRRAMAPNHGMLFVFPLVEQQCMWMRNTLLPLSVAFLDEKGTILNVEDMQPQTENSHCSSGPARYALEMNQGWFAGKGIKPGVRVGGLEAAGPPVRE